jgi:A/G-specific adenine glycosylase
MDWRTIAQRLAEWHAAQQRLLPWRNAPAGRRDPYMVWVCEIMAQQTRLETVRDYFVRWMARFPTVTALAAAEQQEVLKAWEGLGYYARARNLHEASQYVVAEHGGHVPATRRELLALPGIGEYTAGAILSLAYGQPEPILDGNVKRVFSRLADIAEPIEDPAVINNLWAMARAVVGAAEPGEAGAVNEGLMELGATVCTPTTPRCLVCPLNAHCRAAALGTQAARPVRRARKAIPHITVAAGVIWQGEPYRSKLLIAQRPAAGMLGGLWEFPGGKLDAEDADLASCLRREIREELGIEIEVGAPLTVVRHTFTHFKMTLHALHARHVAGEPQAIGCADWRWVEVGELESYPFPVADLKIIKQLQMTDYPPS